jgi:hypothetical protein
MTDPVVAAKVGTRRPDLRVRVRCSSLNSFLIRSKNRMKKNPLLLICAGLRSKASASAHGVPTPLTRKGETLGDSDIIFVLRGITGSARVNGNQVLTNQST